MNYWNTSTFDADCKKVYDAVFPKYQNYLYNRNDSWNERIKYLKSIFWMKLDLLNCLMHNTFIRNRKIFHAVDRFNLWKLTHPRPQIHFKFWKCSNIIFHHTFISIYTYVLKIENLEKDVVQSNKISKIYIFQFIGIKTSYTIIKSKSSIKF